MSIAHHWGSTPEERASSWPCDAWPEGEAIPCWRGVDVAAPAERVFRWLCQLRVAPYSYDWIDNFGRRSPRQLTPGLEQLEEGQTVMAMFELRSFTPGREITLASKAGAGFFGEVAVTYRVTPRGPEHSRLAAKLRFVPPRGPWGWLLARWLPWGDLIMMRRQLLNLKHLAEHP